MGNAGPEFFESVYYSLCLMRRRVYTRWHRQTNRRQQNSMNSYEKNSFGLKFCPACHQQFRLDVAANYCPADNTRLAFTREDPYLGAEVCDRYKIFGIIGEGGFGRVYRAEHKNIPRHVAIKVLHWYLLDDEEKVRRFQNEARTASLIDHRNVVEVHDYGLMPNGEPYLAMDYLQGETLAQLLDRAGKLDWKTAADILQQAAAGLNAVHQCGFVHRDVKPSNIFLTLDPLGNRLIQLLDFGLTKSFADNQTNLSNSGLLVGTPDYMSPEQYCGKPLDGRSDIYSLGCVLYEALTGLRPFKSANPLECLVARFKGEFRPVGEMAPDVPASIEQLILKMVTVSADERISSMHAVSEALQSAQ